jgi:hypothetical protein
MTQREETAPNLELGLSDIILPSQYFGAMRSTGLSSEQRLMLSVLVDAINLIRGWQGTGSARRRQAFAEAAHWINVTRTNYPFSFESICDALGIDAEIVRRWISRLTKRQANMARVGSVARPNDQAATPRWTRANSCVRTA